MTGTGEAAREFPRGGAQRSDLTHPQPHPRTPPHPRASRLHLDAHHRVAVDRDQVDFGEPGEESTRNDAHAAPAKLSRGPPLSRATPFPVVGDSPREREAGGDRDHDVRPPPCDDAARDDAACDDAACNATTCNDTTSDDPEGIDVARRFDAAREIRDARGGATPKRS